MSDFNDITWTSADGLKLHARDYPADGNKAPAICLHGLTRNARDFEELAPRIQATGRRVIAVDVRGRGESDRDHSRRGWWRKRDLRERAEGRIGSLPRP